GEVDVRAPFDVLDARPLGARDHERWRVHPARDVALAIRDDPVGDCLLARGHGADPLRTGRGSQMDYWLDFFFGFGPGGSLNSPSATFLAVAIACFAGRVDGGLPRHAKMTP